MGWIGDEIRYDCIYYVGEKPCVYRRACHGCLRYVPMGQRTLIIKLAAMGDVLRTTSILPSLAKRLAEKEVNCFVTWIVDPPSRPLLEHNPLINRLWTVDLETMLRLQHEEFDLALCFDKEPRAVGLMALCKAKEKRGFTMGAEGNLRVVNAASEEALLSGMSDFFKFQRQRKSYQQVIHEMAEIPSAGPLYLLRFTDGEKAAARARLAELGATRRPLIGLNTGAGTVFPGKRWAADNFARLGKRLQAATGATIVLLGGPQEVERNRAIAAQLAGCCIDLGTDNPLRSFAAMVAELDLLVCGDTMALHVGLAADVPTVALFGPTPAHEVDMGPRGIALSREPFGPGIMGRVDEASSAIQEIPVEEVESACLKLLRR
jgi:heptosyltransferase-2